MLILTFLYLLGLPLLREVFFMSGSPSQTLPKGRAPRAPALWTPGIFVDLCFSAERSKGWRWTGPSRASLPGNHLGSLSSEWFATRFASVAAALCAPSVHVTRLPALAVGIAIRWVHQQYLGATCYLLGRYDWRDCSLSLRESLYVRCTGIPSIVCY